MKAKYHMCRVVFPNKKSRDAAIEKLRETKPKVLKVGRNYGIIDYIVSQGKTVDTIELLFACEDETQVAKFLRTLLKMLKIKAVVP